MPDIYITEDEAMQLLSQIYAERGYLVLARHTTKEPYQVGQITTDVKLFYADATPITQPFRITAISTFEEYLQQSLVLGATRQDLIDYYSDGMHQFYRVESD